MIHVQGLTKYYGAFPAIQDLNFHADKGEIVGFLGPNGAGKTTAMRILTGYMPPSEGVVKVAGFDVIDESLEVRKRVGYLPETVPLYPEMSVYDYLEYMGSLRQVEDLEDRIYDVVEEVNLVDRIDSFIGNLSKGLRQRVGLAQALVHQPPVLILDEPTIGLDPAQIIEVRNLIGELRADRTVLLSTHILSEAQQVCDRVLIINHGQIVAEDAPSNLQTQLAGGDRLYVQANTDRSELSRILKQVSGVLEVNPMGEEGAVEVSSKPGVDIRPAIAKAVVSADIDLLELRSVGINLEDIFLQLTREEGDDDREE